MAHVSANSKQIRIQIRFNGERKITTVDLEPTKANLKAQKIRADDAQEQLKQGRPWELVRAWLRDEQPEGEPSAFAQTVGYYAQLMFDTAEVADTTLQEYENTYHRVWSRFDSWPIDSLDFLEITRALANLNSKKTKKNALSVLSKVFFIAIKDKNCPLKHNPCSNWTFKKEQKTVIDPYSQEEKQKLLSTLASFNSREAYYFYVAAFGTGARPGELYGLRWDCVDLTNEVAPMMHIRRAISRGKLGPVKTRQERTVSLTQDVAAMLRDNPSRFKSEFVFLRPHKTTGDLIPMVDGEWIQEQWHLAHDLADIRLRPPPYPYRHTYISNALQHGVNEFWLCKQTGHDLATMRKHYAKWIKENIDAERRNLAILESETEKRHTNGTQSDDQKT